MAEAKKRRHIGVLCSTIEIATQYDVWKGIAEIAEANDIHLTAYIGTYQTTDNNFASHMESCCNTMWAGDLLDGVIILSGFIAQNIGLDEFSEYAERIPKDAPAVSVSFEIPGIPSVLTYNKTGMYSAIDHLIKVHEKKHIAFVKGPDGHPEAESRLLGYKEALEANGIPFDENYLFDGDFGRAGGRKAVADLYDVRKIPVDAIACCNDQSAVGVLSILNTRGLMVPGDLEVIGFDNDIISSIYVPTISTVGQDFTELGRVSAKLLIDQINGVEVDPITYIVPEFIARQSCGCMANEYENVKDEKEESDESGAFSSYIKGEFAQMLHDEVPAEQIEAWADTILEKLYEKPFSKTEFLNAFDKMLVACYHSYSRDFAVWHKLLIKMAMAIEIHRSEFEYAYTMLTTLTFATTLVYDIRHREERKKEYTLNDDRMRKRRITNALLIMFDVETLAEELYKSISSISINTALIGLYSEPVKRGDRYGNRTIETLIGFDGEDRFNVQHNSWSPILFSDFSTIDGFDFERFRRTMIYQPLFFMEEEVGVMLLPYDSEIPADAYETLRLNISTAIKGAKLVETIHTLAITDELTNLLNRRGFFQFTYSRLQHLQRDPDIVPVVMFMDMDALKQINDNYGHSEGDTAISVFAAILKDTMREEDIIGRIGGDEFAAFTNVKSKDNARQLERRIRKAFDEYNERGLHPYKVNGSIGSVILDESTRECFESAMHKADSVLYEEKMEKKKVGLSR
ncbi:MAG: GGDEF domain-containing protein [Oscillospiraceae bacterium]|nr:GGDEF domain-containing protein [Oscillospiraceae bacterium]